MYEKLIELLENMTSTSQSDVVLDQLNDLVEGDLLAVDQKEELAVNVLRVADYLQSTEAAFESAMNLLGSLSEDDICTDLISQFVATRIEGFPPGILAHAIPIIAFSNLPNRIGIVEAYVLHPNEGVRQVAEESLKLMSN